MKIKPFAALLTAAVLCCFGSSCSYSGSGIEGLMQPPRASGELYYIQSALTEYAGSNIEMKYPKRGENNTAFVLEDIDGDGTEEAFAFYVSSSDVGIAPVHINVIVKQDEEWSSVDDINTGAGDIDSITFADISGDGVKEILIGTVTYTTSENQLNLYSLSNGHLSQKMKEIYSEFIVGRLSDVGHDELLVINAVTADKRSDAKLYSLDGDTLVLRSTVQLDGNITGYAKVQTGKMSNGINAVFADAYKGTNSMITELIYFDKDKLVAPLIDPVSPENHYALRYTMETCRDVNNDGFIDVPFSELLPGYTSKVSTERMYLTAWKTFDGQKFYDVFRGDFNYSDGYAMRFPDVWVGNVTVMRDLTNRMRSYRQWDAVDGVTSDELLRVRVYSESEYSSMDTTGIIELGRTNSLVYAARIVKTEGEYALTENKVRQMFSLIS